MMKQINLILISLIVLLPLAACGEKAEQTSEAAKAVEQSSPVKTAVTAPVTMEFKEGVHFVMLANRVTPLVPSSKIEVVEMFYYGCPNCFYLESPAMQWKSSAADDVAFKVIPAATNPAWSLFARGYYAAEELGILESSHETLFKSIHEQGRRIHTEDALVRFYVRQGADEAKFRAAMNGDAVGAKVKRAETLGNDYGLTGVPSLIVDGQYRVLLDNISSYDELFAIVDYLLEKVRASRS